MDQALSDSAVVVGVRSRQPALLGYGRTFAQLLGARLRVVHAYAPPYAHADLYITEAEADSYVAAANGVMADAQAYFDETGIGADVELELVHGYPPAALVAEGREAKALVIGTDDVSWFERITGAAVSSHVALHADCPVVVVPPSVSTSAMTEVAVAIDGKTAAHGPLKFAFELAARAHAGLRVIHVGDPATSVSDTEARELRIAEVLSGWRQEYPEVPVTPEIWAGDPVDETVRAAADAGLLVVGKPHAGRWHLPGRAVAASLLRVATFPITVVPADYGT